VASIAPISATRRLKVHISATREVQLCSVNPIARVQSRYWHYSRRCQSGSFALLCHFCPASASFSCRREVDRGQALDPNDDGESPIHIPRAQTTSLRAKLGWGVSTITNAFIRGRAALIATRLMVGAFEAGFYPTASAYLSYFYCRYDLAVRLALFYGQFAIAGAFSGSIGMSLRVPKCG
jgi:hypothetical protein